MLGSLRGTLIYTTPPDQILIEVAGIGYRVTLGKSSMDDLISEGSEIMVFISHQVREDSETLYGFLDIRNKETFELLLKIHKVGPAMAMEILDNYNISELQQIVANKDLIALTNISGVGKTTAERLLTELKNKLDITDIKISDEAGSPTQDVRQALLKLGYTNAEIQNALQEISKDLEVDQLLIEALKLLGPSK